MHYYRSSGLLSAPLAVLALSQQVSAMEHSHNISVCNYKAEVKLLKNTIIEIPPTWNLRSSKLNR